MDKNRMEKRAESEEKVTGDTFDTSREECDRQGQETNTVNLLCGTGGGEWGEGSVRGDRRKPDEADVLEHLEEEWVESPSKIKDREKI